MNTEKQRGIVVIVPGEPSLDEIIPRLRGLRDEGVVRPIAIIGDGGVNLDLSLMRQSCDVVVVTPPKKLEPDCANLVLPVVVAEIGANRRHQKHKRRGWKSRKTNFFKSDHGVIAFSLDIFAFFVTKKWN